MAFPLKYCSTSFASRAFTFPSAFTSPSLNVGVGSGVGVGVGIGLGLTVGVGVIVGVGLVLGLGLGFAGSFTLTSQVAFVPLLELAVIVAVPPPIAVILPLLSTVATALLLEYHLSFGLSVVLVGEYVAESCAVSPFSSVIDVLFIVILVIGVYSPSLK